MPSLLFLFLLTNIKPVFSSNAWFDEDGDTCLLDTVNVSLELDRLLSAVRFERVEKSSSSSSGFWVRVHDSNVVFVPFLRLLLCCLWWKLLFEAGEFKYEFAFLLLAESTHYAELKWLEQTIWSDHSWWERYEKKLGKNFGAILTGVIVPAPYSCSI